MQKYVQNYIRINENVGKIFWFHIFFLWPKLWSKFGQIFDLKIHKNKYIMDFEFFQSIDRTRQWLQIDTKIIKFRVTEPKLWLFKVLIQRVPRKCTTKKNFEQSYS
jgi:hypothetical protein